MNAALENWPYPFWIAHRGAGKEAPENTMAAFSLGARHGFTAFECDVKLSADGIPFLLHDDTLERTTDGYGVAGHLPWLELSRLDAGRWHGEGFAGESLARLETLLRWIYDNGLYVNLEIKPTPGLELETGRAVAAMVSSLSNPLSGAPGHAGRLANRCYPLLSSFRSACLEGAKDVAPLVPRALLVGTWRATAIDEADLLGCKALIFKYTLVDQGVVRRCHSRGLRVLAYTVNEPSEAKRLAALRVDGLITDNMNSLSLLS